MLHRIWDWIVGLTMIAIAILAGGVVSGMIAIPVTIGLGYLIDIQGKKGGPVIVCSMVAVFTILQAAGFYDFYRRRRASYATGEAGLFHLVPRAIQRMRTGNELEGFVDAATGKPTTVQAPINAARRGVIALFAMILSVVAVVFGATSKGEWPLVVAGLGLIGVLLSLAFLVQVTLAYAGLIRRV